MFVDFPQELILMTAGAFVLGWILSMISSAIGSKAKARRRDPRDDRIRSLEAELRIAQSETDKVRDKLETTEKERDDAVDGNEKRDNVIAHQQTKLDDLKKDLTDSVKKTRELRAELQDRATENVKSEAKLREVETELSVAQASTDLIATGVLDYSIAQGGEAAELGLEDDDVGDLGLEDSDGKEDVQGTA